MLWATGPAFGAARFDTSGLSPPGSGRSSSRLLAVRLQPREFVLQGQGFGGEVAGGLEGVGVLVPQRVKAGGGQRLLLATDAFYFACPGVGIKSDRDENPAAGLLDALFHPQSVVLRAARVSALRLRRSTYGSLRR